MGSLSLQFPSLDKALADFEGFGKPGTLATANNNPGNLQYGSFAINHGATGVNKGFAIFPDSVTGTSAEDALVSSYASQGLTIDELINKWAPPSAPGNTPESTQNYIQTVSQKLGVTPDTPVSSVQDSALTKAQATATASLPSWAKTLLNLVPGGSTAAGVAGIDTGVSPFSWGRVGAFLLGLVFIVGGLYLFKPVQEVVNRTAKTAARIAIL